MKTASDFKVLIAAIRRPRRRPLICRIAPGRANSDGRRCNGGRSRVGTRKDDGYTPDRSSSSIRAEAARARLVQPSHGVRIHYRGWSRRVVLHGHAAAVHVGSYCSHRTSLGAALSLTFFGRRLAECTAVADLRALSWDAP